jgi:Ca2+-transporting ATPase
MTWRIIYQGIMIGVITLIAFILGLASSDSIVSNLQIKYPLLSVEEIKVEVGQTMAFIVIAFAELIHVFNIRNNKKSIFKTGIGGNKWLFIALLVASALMLLVILVPGLQGLFGIIMLPSEKIIECILLIIAPVVIVEIMKLLKINSSRNE